MDADGVLAGQCSPSDGVLMSSLYKGQHSGQDSGHLLRPGRLTSRVLPWAYFPFQSCFSVAGYPALSELLAALWGAADISLSPVQAFPSCHAAAPLPSSPGAGIAVALLCLGGTGVGAVSQRCHHPRAPQGGVRPGWLPRPGSADRGKANRRLLVELSCLCSRARC